MSPRPVGIAPESEFVVVTVLPSESVVTATPVASATRMPKDVLREVMLLPALSVVVTVVVAVAVVSAVQPDQVVQGAEEPQGPSVQPVVSKLAYAFFRCGRM